MSARTRRAHDESVSMLERLESRIVLATTDIAAVGLVYQASIMDDAIASSSHRAYVLEGSVSSSNRLDFSLRWDGATGPLAPSPLRSAEIRIRDDGSFDYQSARWPALGAEAGAQFLPQDGYGIGWWRAIESQFLGNERTPTTTHSEQQLIVPLASLSTSMSAVRTQWVFSMIEQNPTTLTPTIRTGLLNIQRQGVQGDFVSFVDPSTGETISRSRVVTDSGGSRFTTNGGLRFYLSADGSTLIFADLARGDGRISVGFAVRASAAATVQDTAGEYRLLSNLGAIQSVDRTLTLRDDGTYRVPDGSLFGGSTTAPESGTWFVHQGREIVLRPSEGGPEHRFRISDSGGALVLASTSQSQTPFAIATRATMSPTRSAPIITTPSNGAEGQGLVFIDRSNAPWKVADVAAESGGPSVTGELVTWFDSRSGLARAAAVTDRGLTIYSELSSGAWSFNVLPESLGTGTQISSSIALTTGPGGAINIFALSTEGDLLRYVQSQNAQQTWNEWNVTANQLEPRGLQTPGFIGKIVALATPWGGLNIAGIDASGSLQTVWTTLTAGRWFVSDLTTNAGGPALFGDLDVAVAGPRGIHFSSFDQSGRITLISWRPGDARWSSSTISTSPIMQNGEIGITYDATTRSLYVATLRVDTGSIVVHTLALDFLPPTIPSVTFSGFGSSAERRVVSNLDVSVGPDGLINIFGINENEETVRFFAEWSFTSDWSFENLTDITL